MNKSQLLILLLIIALAFYYGSEDKPYQSTKPNFKKPLPKSIQASKPSLPKSQKPYEPTETKWPADTPIIEFPAATWVVDEPNHPEPANFGLNPPHSQVDEPWEPPEPPPEPKPIIKTLNCPSAESVFDPENIQATELTPQEKALRQAQELSDYHWLLNHKTIQDWHQEQKLTDSQFQVLRGLVDNEEMNSLEYFLNNLPANYEWTLIDPQFKAQPSLIEKWKTHFTYQQTNDWLKIGLKPTDYALATWLQNTKNLTPEETLNFADFKQLKEEFSHYGN